jgi:hypothetical protein
VVNAVKTIEVADVSQAGDKLTQAQYVERRRGNEIDGLFMGAEELVNIRQAVEFLNVIPLIIMTTNTPIKRLCSAYIIWFKADRGSS